MCRSRTSHGFKGFLFTTSTGTSNSSSLSSMASTPSCAPTSLRLSTTFGTSGISFHLASCAFSLAISLASSTSSFQVRGFFHFHGAGGSTKNVMVTSTQSACFTGLGWDAFQRRSFFCASVSALGSTTSTFFFPSNSFKSASNSSLVPDCSLSIKKVFW